jgi:hypothetical protein
MVELLVRQAGGWDFVKNRVLKINVPALGTMSEVISKFAQRPNTAQRASFKRVIRASYESGDAAFAAWIRQAAGEVVGEPFDHSASAAFKHALAAGHFDLAEEISKTQAWEPRFCRGLWHGALIRACAKGRLAVARDIVRRGRVSAAELLAPNSPGCDDFDRDFGKAPVPELVKAAKNGHLSIVRWLSDWLSADLEPSADSESTRTPHLVPFLKAAAAQRLEIPLVFSWPA